MKWRHKIYYFYIAAQFSNSNFYVAPLFKESCAEICLLVFKKKVFFMWKSSDFYSHFKDDSKFPNFWMQYIVAKCRVFFLYAKNTYPYVIPDFHFGSVLCVGAFQSFFFFFCRIYGSLEEILHFKVGIHFEIVSQQLSMVLKKNPIYWLASLISILINTMCEMPSLVDAEVHFHSLYS